MSNIPADLKYAKSHEWVRVSGDLATVGITDHAQHELTDVVFVELPELHKKLRAGDACAVVESVKTASDIYSPVSGEVTELGMFHTVLLETGNWSDSGHPTGRRVTFTNSFAIEGHYFNFSTSGQWLWDQLQVIVPLGRDPYPIVEAITQQVTQATADSARQAEQEWQRAVPAQRAKSFSGTPGVNLKPVVGGVEISVRYITRANERYLVRAKLYHQAVDLLGATP